VLVIIATFSATTGCSFVIARSTQNFADGLSSAMANANDPQTVEAALPAYILTLEGMLVKDLNDADKLAATAKLYLVYGSLLESDPVRARRLSDKAYLYARRSACLSQTQLCQLEAISFQSLTERLKQASASDVAPLYLLSATWGQWIQTHKEDWAAVAQLAQVKAIMRRIVELDEAHDHGAVHIYLGIMESLVPPAMGGKPELAKHHFERALEISANKNLSAKVSYAQHYARLLFDRELHDRLLQEVISSDAQVEGLTLSNVIAQQQARQLLDSADAYF